MNLNLWFIWIDLERREKDEYRAAKARLGPVWNLDAHWILLSPFPGWRVNNVRSALDMANHEAVRRLAERLAGLTVGVIARALVETCRDIALVWGGSTLLGAGTGAAIGSLAGGVGAVPGALAGAGVGTQVGARLLGALGLAELLQDLGSQVPQALSHYARGLELAWGRYSLCWTEEPDVHRASKAIAEGHVLLAVAVLSALAAYLTRGRGDPAVRGRILQQMRENPRLGAKVADWVAAHEDELVRNPALKPKQHQVTMAAAPARDVGPPVTPSQLRRAKAEAEGPPGGGRPPEPPKPPPRPPEPGRLPPKPVPCFHPYDKRKFRRLAPDKQREYLEDMARQLRRQEERINDLTAAQLRRRGTTLPGTGAIPSRQVSSGGSVATSRMMCSRASARAWSGAASIPVTRSAWLRSARSS